MKVGSPAVIQCALCNGALPKLTSDQTGRLHSAVIEVDSTAKKMTSNRYDFVRCTLARSAGMPVVEGPVSFYLRSAGVRLIFLRIWVVEFCCMQKE